ncbi:MAG: LSM domain-containing protein [Candidatus Hydrothermarchaeales archaeon]
MNNTGTHDFKVGDELNPYLGKPVLVRLKNGKEFKGLLRGFDEYINLVIDDAEEIGTPGRQFDTLIFKGGLVGSITPE